MLGPRGTVKLIGLSGNLKRPSKTHALVGQVLEAISLRYGVDGIHLDLSDALPELGLAFERDAIKHGLARVIELIETADILVVGSPVYKGSYSGLFKHLFDLVDPNALSGMPVVITATGGGDRHALVVEQSMRPLFGFFMAHAMPTAIYASARDFDGDRVVSSDTLKRIDGAVAQLGPFVTAHNPGRRQRLQPAEDGVSDQVATFDCAFS
ncbi:FMN reductase [Bradyrhizobium archetypum]|uniref:FMN reductase n=1 Tax=Bradyrhizobium archetypum TaxID=2721160 RepID=A0A7Y4M140_9BRAD|nr:FMN reductase [Bradyrhizobium archetypum]NOJ45974.1 FMN reductase [Bradyrhizobium archetypum]